MIHYKWNDINPPHHQRTLCSLSTTKPRYNHHKYRVVCGRCKKGSLCCIRHATPDPAFSIYATIYPLCPCDQSSFTKPVCCALCCLASQSDLTELSVFPVLSVFWPPGQPYLHRLWSWIVLHLLWTWRTRHKVLEWLVWGPCDWELCNSGGLNVRNDCLL